MTEYEAVPHRVRAVTWPGDGIDVLRRLAGEDNVCEFPGGIQVRNSEGEWFTLGDGWVLAVGSDGSRRLLTPGALAAHYRPVTN